MIFAKKNVPMLLMYREIWSRAPYNTMTSLIYFNQQWLCAFIESQELRALSSYICIIRSKEGEDWTFCQKIEKEGISLSHPQLSINAEGTLLCLCEALTQEESTQPETYISLSQNGYTWSTIRPILDSKKWLNKVFWYNGQGFGMTCRHQKEKNQKSSIENELVLTQNGVDYSSITPLSIVGGATEAAFGFLRQGQLIGLFRRFQEDQYAWIGTSPFPFYDWKWQAAQYHIAGPEFIVDARNRMWASGRLISSTPYGTMNKVVLMRFYVDSLEPMVVLPSGGKEVGAPSMCLQHNLLWISYHSSHEQKTAIYLACVQLPAS